MKRIYISLAIIGIISVIAIGATIAYFNDTETSSGNIFVAGNLDLKVDHIKQTYNDVDCNTCSVLLISDTSNIVTEKTGGGPETPPFPAVFVSWIHPRWTAQNDPQLAASGAKWIWATDPTTQYDATHDVTYTFKKTFEWWGPIVGSDLWFAVGSDNSVKVYLNGIKIGENTSEYGYQQEHMLHIPGSEITNNIVQGNNVLEFKVKNWAQSNGTPTSNPGGLIYKFSIDGLCGDDYFKNHCMLWGEKDLTSKDHFFDFDDIKPGDHGVNVISFHSFDNDAWACLIIDNKEDAENDITDSESKLGDNGEPGELSQFIEVFGWMDNNHNGIYEPNSGENQLFDSSLEDPIVRLAIADSTHGSKLTASTTNYIGLAWCAGTQTVKEDGTILCDGSGMGNIAQSDSLTADITAYIEQWRNNPDFECAKVQLER